jgi:hypothetical protein
MMIKYVMIVKRPGESKQIRTYRRGFEASLRCKRLGRAMLGEAGSMSGLAPEADILAAFRHFRKVPEAAVSNRSNTALIRSPRRLAAG